MPIQFSGVFLALALAAISLPATAAQFTGKVVGVADGDTLTVLTAGNVQVKVRLSAIDAPEKAQPFGTRSKQALSDLCFGKTAVVESSKKDRYGRTVGAVLCDGKSVEAEMLRSGMAWVYRQYAKGRWELYAIEDAAKSAKRGLWADPNPVPPWEWRKAKRKSK